MNRLACLLAAVVLFVSVAAAQSKKVVVFDLSPTELADLRSVSANLALAEATTKDALEKVADADAVLGGVSPEMVKAARKLQWVQIYSAGVEGYMFRELVNSNITVTNTKIIQGPEIADHAFALLLALTRKINLAVARRASEEWRPEGFDAIELTGKRALIIGLGGIGAQIAQRAWAFGMKVEAVDPRDTPITAMVER
ncbi:MAG: hypothetical protein HY236_16460, partial [Acidobacteria bacterium]|nr:hypothetical protein [Acidobacteriota bacterium]